MAGNAVKSQGNITLTYNDQDLTCYANQANLNATAESIEATVFCSTGAESIPDSPTWAIDFSGYWDVLFDGYIFPDIIAPGTKRNAVIGFTDASAAVVTYTWTANAEIQSAGITAAIGSLIGHSITLSLSGAPVRAVA